jgi:hypothetical protein
LYTESARMRVGGGTEGGVVARLVFYNVNNPEVSKIGMGLLFHRVIILGRGLTELDHSTVASHRFSAEVAS